MGEYESATERSQNTAEGALSMELAVIGVLPADRLAHRLDAKNAVSIGRGCDCTIQLARSRVSRRHAEIRVHGPLVSIRDLGSTNGLYVDGRRTEHAPLRPGSLIRVGDWLGLVATRSIGRVVVDFGELAEGLWGGEVLANTFELVRVGAPSNLPVVLIGATGTGKERFARAVHAASGRTGPFHAINCAALPDALAEGELFGYRKGAFTGADRAHIGQLRAAHGGTLFLDEIGDLSLPTQAKLLRAIETRCVTPLGDTAPVPFDARIVAASQRPLANLIEERRFREDLAARLAAITIEIPELRQRRADIPSLFFELLRLHSGGRPPLVTTKFYERLCLYDWPANVRELELLAQHLLILRKHVGPLDRQHLPAQYLQPAPVDITGEAEEGREARELTIALRATQGNVKAAAAIIGMSRQRAYRIIESRSLGELLIQARNNPRSGSPNPDRGSEN